MLLANSKIILETLERIGVKFLNSIENEIVIFGNEKQCVFKNCEDGKYKVVKTVFCTRFEDMRYDIVSVGKNVAHKVGTTFSGEPKKFAYYLKRDRICDNALEALDWINLFNFMMRTYLIDDPIKILLELNKDNEIVKSALLEVLEEYNKARPNMENEASKEMNNLREL